MEQDIWVEDGVKPRWSLQHLSGYLVAVCVGGILTLVGMGLWGRTQPVPLVITPPEATATAAPTATPSPVRVYINGAVAQPDVYQLPYDGIVEDLLVAAGGFTADAHTAPVNLAQPLVNGMQIYVPEQTEAESWPVMEETTAIVTGVGQEGEAPVARETVMGGVININTATAAELETLPGVGPSTAAKIVAHREENGLFATIESITDVSGIGEGKFEGMRESITVGE